jgi:hypothetical protein
MKAKEYVERVWKAELVVTLAWANEGLEAVQINCQIETFVRTRFNPA